MSPLLATTLTYVSASQTTQIFLISSLALLIGLLFKIHRDAIHVRFLDSMPLNRIELEQMHIPSFRAIVGMFFCSSALLLVVLSLQADPHTTIQNAYWWLPAASLFILGISVAILAELRFRQAKEYAFAFIVGSTLAFITLLLFSGQSVLWMFLQVVLLLFVTAFAWRLLRPIWAVKIRIASVLIFLFWTLLFFRDVL